MSKLSEVFDEDTLQLINECRQKPMGHLYDDKPKVCKHCKVSRRRLRKYGLANEFLQKREAPKSKKKKIRQPSPVVYKKKKHDSKYDEVELDAVDVA